MMCYFLIMFVVNVKYAVLETATREPTKDVNTTTTSQSEYQSTQTSSVKNMNMKSLWVYSPPSLQSQGDDKELQNVQFKSPHLLTRLAKPFNFGIDPYFKKDYFAPFETRSRPITLVAFKKNTLMPRRNVRQSGSAEVAVLQSPFNEIGTLWQEEPDVFDV